MSTVENDNDFWYEAEICQIKILQVFTLKIQKYPAQ